MIEKLTALYNTMSEVEVKGESAIIMTDCLKFLKNLITEEQKRPKNKKDSKT